MALRTASGTGGAIEFWDSVASTFGSNDHVIYELYNEPHFSTDDPDAQDIFESGNETYVGMLEMIATIRKYSTDSMLIIGGSEQWAYYAQS
jgi:aryl-phospho-beta-D-glucosidase BglC (GH1 family)